MFNRISYVVDNWANYTWLESVHCTEIRVDILYSQNKSTDTGCWTNHHFQCSSSTPRNQQKKFKVHVHRKPCTSGRAPPIRNKQELNRCFEDYTYYITLDPKMSHVVHDARCFIKAKECNFFGMHYTPDGVKLSKLSPDKNNDKEELEPSKDKNNHTFLGMAPYLRSFIPKLADHAAHIGDLLKGNVDFVEFITLTSFCQTNVNDFCSSYPSVL